EQSGQDDLGCGSWHKRSAEQRVTQDEQVRREVEMLVVILDAAAAPIPEVLDRFQPTVTIGVTQSRNTAVGAIDRDVDVAVRRHRQIASRAEPPGRDERKEPGRQREPAVVFVTCRPGTVLCSTGRHCSNERESKTWSSDAARAPHRVPGPSRY